MIPNQGTQGCSWTARQPAFNFMPGDSCRTQLLPGWGPQVKPLPAGTHLAHGCRAEGLIDCLPDAAPVLCVWRGQHAVVLGGILNLQKGKLQDGSGGQLLTSRRKAFPNSKINIPIRPGRAGVGCCGSFPCPADVAPHPCSPHQGQHILCSTWATAEYCSHSAACTSPLDLTTQRLAHANSCTRRKCFHKLSPSLHRAAGGPEQSVAAIMCFMPLQTEEVEPHLVPG